MINKSKIIKDAQKFVAKGQLDKAIAEYDKILKESPNDSNTLNTVGDLYLKRGDKENSIDSFKKAAEVFNKDGFTLKAIALYKKVLNINPDRVDILMLMGKLNAERGLIGSANEHYLAAAAYFSRQGQKVKAVDIYKTLCDLNPDNLSLTQNLAELYLSEGFEKEGISKLIELADKKITLGELREARDFLDKAAPKSADRFEFIRVSALLELKENRIPEAISLLEKARSLDPTQVGVATMLAEAFHRSGRYEEAAGIYQELLQKDPGNESGRKQLIEVLVKTGDYSAAWKEYGVLVENHLAKNELSEAEGLIREFLKHRPDDTDARQSLISIFRKTGRENEIPALHREIADIYFKAGDSGKAANVYRQILELEPENAEIKARLSEIEHGAAASVDMASEPPSVEAAPPAMETARSDVEAAPPVEEFAPPRMEEQPATDSLVDDLGIAGLPQAEEEQPGAGMFELPGEPGEFPHLDLGEDTPFEGIPETGDNAFELPDAGIGGLEDLDTFEIPPAPEGFAEAGETGMDEFSGEGGAGTEDSGPSTLDADLHAIWKDAVSDTPASDVDIAFSDATQQEVIEELAGGFPAHNEEEAISGATPQGVTEETASLEEQLTEIDVYIKYGLFNKAEEVIITLESTYPANPDITKKKIELSKVYGDVDGFVQQSNVLAELYIERGMAAEAQDVVKKAMAMDPDNPMLVSMLERLSDMAKPEAEAPVLEPAGPVGTFAPDETETAMLPGSVHYIEDLAEADFYAQQGLVQEAREIYSRMLSSNPDDAELRARLDGLQDAKAAAAEIELVPVEKVRPVHADPVVHKEPAPVAVPAAPVAETEEARPVSLEDDLDAAFKEMDFDEEEEAPAEAPVTPSPVMSAPAPSAEPEETEFFDLAAELQEELEEEILEPEMPAEEFEDKHLEAVFQEFKKGVEEQLGKEDYETHYNLGIAYKEMGMLDEAISEFTLASRDPARSLDCASMLGLCYMEKAEYDKAIALFNKGLEIKGRDKEEYMGIKYDLAEAYEQAGDTASAYACIKEIADEDEGFRDVKFRLEALEKALGGPIPLDESPVKKGADAKPAAPSKKNKVSYL